MRTLAVQTSQVRAGQPGPYDVGTPEAARAVLVSRHVRGVAHVGPHGLCLGSLGHVCAAFRCAATRPGITYHDAQRLKLPGRLLLPSHTPPFPIPNTN